MWSFKKRQPSPFLQSHSNRPVKLEIADESILQQLRAIGLTERDLQLLRALKEPVTNKIGDVVDAFYHRINSVPHLAFLIRQHSTTDYLRIQMAKHLSELFSGRIDETYLANRRKVAAAHLRIGLEPVWYVASFQNVQAALLRIIYEIEMSREEEREVIEALSKILSFEKQLVLEAFDQRAKEALQSQQQQLKDKVKGEIGSLALDIEEKSESAVSATETLISRSAQLVVNIQEGVGRSNRSAEQAQQGIRQMDQLVYTSETIAKETNGMAMLIEELNDASHQIEEVVGLVKKIADQTNLLAINSAIEAARAGVHGKGFAVVADEVRKLADQTKQSTDDIAKLVSHSKEKTQAVHEAIDAVTKFAAVGMKESEISKETFQTITDSVLLTIEDLSEFSGHMADMKEVITSIGAVSKKVAATSHELEHALDIL